MDVSLEDILNIRHISPLSFKDFEKYLLFEDFGTENLYFALWLKDYTDRYNAGTSQLQLFHSLSRAKATFFSSDSQYELNLAAVRVAEFYTLIGAIEHGGEILCAPSAYSDITLLSPRSAVPSSEHMLHISACRFVRACSRKDTLSVPTASSLEVSRLLPWP